MKHWTRFVRSRFAATGRVGRVAVVVFSVALAVMSAWALFEWDASGTRPVDEIAYLGSLVFVVGCA